MLRQHRMDLNSPACSYASTWRAFWHAWRCGLLLKAGRVQLCSCSHLTSRLRMLRSDCAASALLVCLHRSRDHQLACIASASVRAAAAPSTLGDSWWPMPAAAVVVCRDAGRRGCAVLATNCCCTSLLFLAASISNLGDGMRGKRHTIYVGFPSSSQTLNG